MRVLVGNQTYDYYLDLDAELDLLFHERNPVAREAYDYLTGIASQRGGVIEGESEVVEGGAHGPEHRLMPVPFRGATLFVVDHSGEPYVPMKPIAEGMGLSWASQTVNSR